MAKQGETKQYVSKTENNYVRGAGIYLKVLTLRETANYLIDDATGRRYKKETEAVDGRVASDKDTSDKWRHVFTYIYEPESPVIAEAIMHNKKLKFCRLVREELDKIKVTDYASALKAAAMLNIPELTAQIPTQEVDQ